MTITAANAGDSVSAQWSSFCFVYDSSGNPQPIGPGQPDGTDNFTAQTGDLSTTINVDSQDLSGLSPSYCTVTGTLTANYTVSGTDSDSMTLSEVQQPATASASATASSSPSPSASTSSPASSSGGLTGSVKGFDGKCLDDMKDSGKERASIAIWSCSGSDKAEKFTYSSGELKINGLCLNAKGNAKSGSKIILWACNGGTNEIWVFNTINHQVELKAHGFALCLDDPAYSTKNGTQQMVYTCHNSPNQHWSLP
jgi:hypothetical protein